MLSKRMQVCRSFHTKQHPLTMAHHLFQKCSACADNLSPRAHLRRSIRFVIESIQLRIEPIQCSACADNLSPPPPTYADQIDSITPLFRFNLLLRAIQLLSIRFDLHLSSIAVYSIRSQLHDRLDPSPLQFDRNSSTHYRSPPLYLARALSRMRRQPLSCVHASNW